MHYEIQSAYNGRIERFERGNVIGFRARWLHVRGAQSSGAWQVDDDGRRWGTTHPGDRLQGDGRWCHSRCEGCDKPFCSTHSGALVCAPCALAEVEEKRATVPLPPPMPAPREGIHVAAAPEGDIQRCARCGDILKATHRPASGTAALPGGLAAYPAGAKVLRGRGGQAMYLGDQPPTCEQTANQ